MIGKSHVTQSRRDVPHAGSPALEPEIESLPFVGRTWYTRGPSYWFRRALMSLFFLVLTALWVWFLWAVVQAVDSQSGRTSSTVLLVIVIVAGFATGWFFLGTLPRGQSRQPSRREAVGTAGIGAAAGTLARAGGMWAGVFLLFGTILTWGPLAVMSIRTFTPVLYGEVEARDRLELWYQKHGRTPPWHGGTAPWDRGPVPSV
jgi:hypothetical protein